MLTFGQAKAMNKKFGPSVGDQINSVLEMFLASGKWKNSIRELDVQIYPFDNNNVLAYQITLPRHFETALGIQFNLERGRTGPGLIQSQWFKYVAPQIATSGWWNGPNNGLNMCYSGGVPDLGDGWATFRDFSVDSFLHYESNEPETSETSNIRGLGTSGQPIYTTTGGYATQGLNFPVDNSDDPIDNQPYLANSPIVVVKPLTRGVMSLFAGDGSSNLLIGMYDPGETVPSYRRYQVPNPPLNVTSARVAAKLRFVPLVSDNDLVIPENASALTYGLEAWNYENAHNADMAQQYWTRAYTVLNGSLREHQGTAFKSFQIVGGSQYGRIPFIK